MVGRRWQGVVVLAVTLPMATYVAGSLVGSNAGTPAPRDPVVVRDAPASPSPEPTRTPSRPPRGGATAPTPPPIEDDGDDDEVRVVTPQPTRVDDDGDDEDDRDEDRGDDGDDGGSGGDD